jgi:hypothetical protein
MSKSRIDSRCTSGIWASRVGPRARQSWGLVGVETFLGKLGDESHYQASSAYLFRASIRLARGDDIGAEEDADKAVEVARPVVDPQILGPALQFATFVFFSVGNVRRAQEVLDELLALMRGLRELGWAVVWSSLSAWVAWKLGRGDEFLDAVSDEPLESPWLRAVRAIAIGDFVPAADIFGEMGMATKEAFFRLCAAEALVAEGRRAEADEQLRPALAFYRGVGATRYVREGEALLAASA